MTEFTRVTSPSTPSTQPWRKETVGRLRSLLIDQNEPILLLGAGCSIRSGIPDAARTVEQAAKWAWCTFNSAPHTDKNLVDEVQTLDPLLVDPLRAMLRDHPVVVVGYRGNEASVIRPLVPVAKAGALPAD